MKQTKSTHKAVTRSALLRSGLGGIAICLIAGCTSYEAIAGNEKAAVDNELPKAHSSELSLATLGSQLLKNGGLQSDKNLITVYFSDEKYTSRAIEVRTLVEEAMAFYKSKLGIDHAIDVALLDRGDWQKYVDQVIPYGMPFIDGPTGSKVAVLPATSDGVISLGAMEMKKFASEETLAKLSETKRSFDDGAATFTDVIAVHELGHAYAEVYGIQTLSSWANEFLATYFAYAFFREEHPDLAAVFELYAYRLNTDAPDPQPDKGLARFERKYTGVGANDYAWYQGMFAGLCVTMYNEKGLGLFPTLKKYFPVDPDRQQGGNPDILDKEFDTFEKISASVKPWRNKSFK